MKKCHVDGAYGLLQCYLKKFDLSPEFTRADFEHFFMPREDVIYSYVALVRSFYSRNFYYFIQELFKL